MATKITIKNHGSIKVESDFELYDNNGNKFDLSGRIAISLCRCGHSKDKPFCDGSHKTVGFNSEVIAKKI